ncbi:Xylulose kinase [subsurface metagenome]
MDTKIVTLNIEEGPAYGAALLAGVGAGIYKSVEEATSRTIRQISQINPIRENVKKYRKIYEIYKSLYEDLKEDFEKLNAI